MILVLGATGTTGGEVARQLIAAGHRPRLLVRHPERARAFEGRADLAVGDLDAPDSLREAMRGVGHVYLVSGGSDLARLERQVVDAAKAAGVEHVVKLSVVSAEAPVITIARWHAEAERYLMDSGLGWTMLRPSNFMTNSYAWADTVRTQGVFYQPTGAGRWAAIDPADIGAVAARALTEPGHMGQAYTLTGPESMDAAGYAAVLSEVLGREVRFVDVPPEAARAAIAATGGPPAFLEAIMDLQAAMKAGRTDLVTDTVPRLLGRPAGTFREWVRRHADAFR